jgi:ATP-dependent protease Clp ATPase subunit
VDEAGGGQYLRRNQVACSFCGMTQPRVEKLIGGTHSYICDQCVATADRVIVTGEAAATPLSALTSVGADVSDATCGFCGKRRDRVAGLAAAGQHTICTECLELCREILDEGLSASDSDG